MTTPNPVGPVWQLLVQKASARATTSAHGNSVQDILAYSRPNHFNLQNVSWWPQKSLNCYTPSPHFYAANSTLGQTYGQEFDTGYPGVPPASALYETVTWQQTQGLSVVPMRVCLPDGNPAVTQIRVMDGGAPPGTVWGIKTLGLPADWYAAAATPGNLSQNRGVMVTVAVGQSDTPDPPLIDQTAETDSQAVTNANQGRAGDVRVMVGNLWSVLIPGDGGSPQFMKKVGTAGNGGLVWDVLHTFTDAEAVATNTAGVVQWLVSFKIVGGRLAVCVSSRDLPTNAFVYFEASPTHPAVLKTLTIPAAPVIVTGRTGGAPVWIGIRRIGHGGSGTFSSTFPLKDASIYSNVGDEPTPCAALPVGYSPPVPLESSVMDVALTCLSPTTVQYDVTLSPDAADADCPAVKWIYFSSPASQTSNDSSYVDYGPALTDWTEDIAEPDFAGQGGPAGAHATLQMTFDTYGLDIIAAANATNWRADLAPYSPAGWMLGVVNSDETQTLSPRIQGYFIDPGFDLNGFQDTALKMTLADPMIRMKDPAGLIDTNYTSFGFIQPSSPVTGIYGYHAIQYLIAKAVDAPTAANLKVFMPPDWFPLFDILSMCLTSGTMPAPDLPLWNPPRGKFAAEWAKDVCKHDFAAFYWAGFTPIYGQYDLVVAGQPTIQIYDGANPDGSPNTIAFSPGAIQWTMTKGATKIRTDRDYNKYIVWGHPPGGVTFQDATQLGAPLINESATNFASVKDTWERAKLFNDMTFLAPSDAKRFIRAVLQKTGAKAAPEYQATFPLPLQNVFWGYTFQIHGATTLGENGVAEAGMNGKTLRVLRMRHSMSGRQRKVQAVVDLVEVI